MEEEKRDHTNRMKKMESEMEQVFEMKVKEKMTKLSDLESDVSVEFVLDLSVYNCGHQLSNLPLFIATVGIALSLTPAFWSAFNLVVCIHTIVSW